MVSCYISQTPAEILVDGQGNQRVHSPRAGGAYGITGSAVPMLAAFNDLMRRSLTNYIVEQNRFGSVPLLTSMNLRESTDHPELSVASRAIGLLRYLRGKSVELGRAIAFYEPDEEKTTETLRYLMAHTASLTPREVTTLAEFCAEERWIKHNPTTKSNGRVRHELVLRPPGFKYLDELDGVARQSDQAFIAMWFDASMDEAAKEGFAAGISDAGYRPLRVDQKEHADKIDDQIIAEIRRSRFVVADFTSEPHKPRGGVYFEAGFARGLGIPASGHADKI